MKISIAVDFSKYPAGRFPEDGPYNGTKFREEVLAPRLRELGESEYLEVTLDGVAGVGSSFLEEAFGGLVRSGILPKEFLEERLIVSAEDDPLRDFARLAKKYIEEATAPTPPHEPAWTPSP
ncbi:MAG: DUF4325 domain-containing protein [Gammaproteobacteria bacterium]|nr:DUF4325 domain-containing protein [Gammaproteobacteria bacterium]MYF66222.1 DUF4325 domain-containing protein [Gammaproteobacteria bacterium]MYK38229.1 DUF4325 domain-containing protein [Gammaproteobacteria bacterium]